MCAKLTKSQPTELVQWLSIAAGIAIGPLFLLLGYRTNLMYGAAAYVYLLVCIAAIPPIVALGGRFRFLVWQLAAVSLALSIVVDDLRAEANPLAHLKEFAGVAFGFWLTATVLSSPLPISLLYERWRRNKEHQEQGRARG
jgi:hypothetical protein